MSLGDPRSPFPPVVDLPRHLPKFPLHVLSTEAFSPVLFLFAGLSVKLQVTVVLSSCGATLPTILFFTLQVHTQHLSVMNHATKGHLGPLILGVQLCHGATSIA